VLNYNPLGENSNLEKVKNLEDRLSLVLMGRLVAQSLIGMKQFKIWRFYPVQICTVQWITYIKKIEGNNVNDNVALKR